MYHCVILYGNDTTPLSKTGGPFRIATDLRIAGFSVICIDLTAFDYKDDFDSELESYLSKCIGSQTLWVGISASFLWKIFGLQHEYDPSGISPVSKVSGITKFVKFVKAINPKTKLILGGTRSWILENKFQFTTFEGPVDEEIVKYTQWLNGDKIQIPLEFYGQKIIYKEYKNFSTSLTKYHADDIVLDDDVLVLETARGCIFKCKFCSFPLNGKTKGDWIKNANVLRDELIDNYRNYGITKYTISDDTFNDSQEKLQLYWDKVFSVLPFAVEFQSYLRLDLLMRNPANAFLLSEMGLKNAIFGIETLNESSARAIGKGVPPQDQIDFLCDLKNGQWKNIRTHSNFILGLPFDTMTDILNLKQWMRSSNNPLDTWTFEPLYLLPKEYGFKKYYDSFFDNNYNQYGYEMQFDTENQNYYWIHEKNGLDFKKCSLLANTLNAAKESLDSHKAGQAFEYMHLRQWCNHEELCTTSARHLYAKYDFQSLGNQKKKKYLQQLSDRLDQISHE